ncbi:hypothetical protein Hanom_Chr05g00462311 [Helianthus anomalus]
MLWMKHRGIISVANSVLNSVDLDKMVAHLLVTACNDGYAQGYLECTQHVNNALSVNWDTSRSATHGVHVNNALRVNWDTSRSATHGVDTGAAHAAAKTEYNNLHLSMMDLVTAALEADDFVAQLKEVYPDEGDDDEDLE